MQDCSCDGLGLDFGSDDKDKLKAYGSHGPVILPATPRGLTPAGRFAFTLESILQTSCIVLESPTIGSSGAEPEEIARVMENSPHKIFMISARRVKNYLKDHSEVEKTDEECARIIYEIATRPNAYLKPWRYIPKDQKFHRAHRSVRPWDKRNYRGEIPDAYMSRLAPFHMLPDEYRFFLTNGLKRIPDYRRAAVFPLAMAFDEEGCETWGGYDNIIGLHENGYPSFYRRCTVSLMQTVAKKTVGVTRFSEVTPGQRKEAWKETKRMIRCIYHLSRQHQLYAQVAGTFDPLAGHGTSLTA